MALPLLYLRIYTATRTLMEASSIIGVKILEKAARLKAQEVLKEVDGELQHAARSTFGLLTDTGRANIMA
jgi:hypothetical protein